MTDKVMPHSIDAEEAVLGSLIIDSDAYYKVSSILAPSDFYREKNAWVYAARQKIDVCDQVTLAHQLSLDGRLEATGGAAYLSHLVANVATSVHIEHYAGIVKKCSDARKLIATAANIEQMGFDMDLEGLEKAQRLLLSFRNRTNRALTPQEQADIFLQYYSDLANDILQPCNFGIPSLDNKGGMQPGEYVVLGGETEMGKTTLLHQIAEQQLGDVLYCTTEMTDKQWVRRSGSQALEVHMSKLGDINWIKSHESDLIKAQAWIAEGNIHIVTGSITPQLVFSETMRLPNVKLIIVDYLQRLKGARASREGASMTSGALADIAKETGTPLIVASQLTREKETREGRPKTFLERLKESGDIENDADWAIFIDRDKDAKPGTPERLKAKIIVEKHKQGGEHFKIPIRFDPKTQVYQEEVPPTVDNQEKLC